jgi:hypothetical protein
MSRAISLRISRTGKVKGMRVTEHLVIVPEVVLETVLEVVLGIALDV